jgi:hypothetical protein
MNASFMSKFHASGQPSIDEDTPNFQNASAISKNAFLKTFMSGEKKGTKGGFHFGNVVGNVSTIARGDIVAGDKTTNTTTTTTIQTGFKSEGDKQQFQNQLEELRAALREIKSHVEATPGLSADEKEELTSEILEHVKALKEVKETTAQLAPAQKPTADIGKTVESKLEKASGILDKLQAIGKKSVDLFDNISGFAVKYGPLVLSTRHLFGLP